MWSRDTLRFRGNETLEVHRVGGRWGKAPGRGCIDQAPSSDLAYLRASNCHNASENQREPKVAGRPKVVGRQVVNPCQGNSAHIRQSRPDYGLGFQAKVLEMVQGVPSSLGSGFRGQRERPVPVPLEVRKGSIIKPVYS